MKAAKKKTEAQEIFGYRKMLCVAVATVIILVSAVFVYLNLSQSPQLPKAAIIDPLSVYSSGSIRHVNSTFIENAKALLYQRFSKVDYYSYNATIESYKNLASLNYKLIIWRVQSARDDPNHFVAISSCERFSSKNYDAYIENDQVTVCNITGEYLFGITPKFIRECMNGRFEDTVIILMSCDGLNLDYEVTAETFVDKGVKVFISWDNRIYPADNDEAIALLLKYLIEDNSTISEAVSAIPVYYTSYGPVRLRYYPRNSEDVANYRIPDYRKSNVTSSAALMVVVFFREDKLN